MTDDEYYQCKSRIWVYWCTEYDKRILHTGDCANCKHCKKDEKVKDDDGVFKVDKKEMIYDKEVE